MLSYRRGQIYMCVCVRGFVRHTHDWFLPNVDTSSAWSASNVPLGCCTCRVTPRTGMMSYFTWMQSCVAHGCERAHVECLHSVHWHLKGVAMLFQMWLLPDWVKTDVCLLLKAKYGNILGKRASRFPTPKDYSYWWCWWHDLSTMHDISVSHQKKPPQRCESGGWHTLVNHICLKGQYIKCRHLITLNQTTKIFCWFKPLNDLESRCFAHIFDVKYEWIKVDRWRGCKVWECVTGAWNSWSPLLGKRKKKEKKLEKSPWFPT